VTRPAAALVLTLPWAVLVPDNARHGVMRGRVLLTKRYREAKEAARMLALGQLRHESPIIACDVAVTIRVHAPDRRRRDIQNLTKLVCDVLTLIAYQDDSQVARLTLERGAMDRVNPRADIEVSPITRAGRAQETR